MEGMPYEQMKDPEKRKMLQERLREASKSVGLKFEEKRTFIPNTIMAHLLTEYAEEHGGVTKQNVVAEKLLEQFFGKGANLDKDFLVKVAAEEGFDKEEVANYLTSPEKQNALKMKAKSWSEKGLHGVPFFIMNGRPTFSGAQEPDVFKSTILKMAKILPMSGDGQKASNSSL